MKFYPGYYLPCERRGVRAAVRQWIERYGCTPQHIGRIRVYRVNEHPIIYAWRGPVFIGPLPAEDAELYPGAQWWGLREFFTIYVRAGGGRWHPELNIDPLDLEEYAEGMDEYEL